MLTVSLLSIMLGLRSAFFYDKQLFTHMNINRAEFWQHTVNLNSRDCSSEKEKDTHSNTPSLSNRDTLSLSRSLPSKTPLFLLFFPHSFTLTTVLPQIFPLFVLSDFRPEPEKAAQTHTQSSVRLYRETACVYIHEPYSLLRECSLSKTN